MSHEKNRGDDTASDISASDFTAYTPSTDSTVADYGSCDGARCAILSPGNIYMIIETTSGRAITLTKAGLHLQDIEEGQTTNNRWLCVSKDGYYGLHNPTTGTYLGHDGNFGMCATATKLDNWELITPREHPNGGYELLSPHWFSALMAVVVAEDGKRLERRPHGNTLWKFVRV